LFIELSSVAQVQADFDRLAQVSEERWNHNSHYHPLLLRHVPANCQHALDLGCGTGTFTRLLAERAAHVYGLDLSPEMIAVARERSAALPNITFHTADVLRWSFPAAALDCIVSIATLHHLPLHPILQQLKAALRPGGVLLVLDLYAPRPADYPWLVLASAVNPGLRLWHTGRIRAPTHLRAAWAAHTRHDHYLPLAEVRHIASQVLPGARVRRHLLWRYSLVWRKDATNGATEERLSDNGYNPHHAPCAESATCSPSNTPPPGPDCPSHG
jgi:SAM-dependent methyltransferase